MCTAATYETEDFYFGRTLDYECSFGEEVVVTPRRFPYSFRNGRKLDEHYAMIGMAHVEEGCPLYYEAVNEKGLGMAGLNFVGNAFYGEQVRGRDNVAFFEFIPWILGQCASLEEARDLLRRIHLTGEAFSSRLPVAQLHWMISGREGSIVVESMKDGLHIHDNPVGVMTNNPPFPLQMFQLNNYMGLSVDEPGNHFSPGHGGFGASRRSVLPVPFCQGGFHQNERCVGKVREGERKPVFPYSGHGGQSKGMLPGMEGSF